MRNLLSVVIPVMRQTDLFEQALVSVLENSPEGCRVVAVFNDEYPDPYDLRDVVDLHFVRPGAGLAECLNAGIEACGTPLVAVLAPGVEVARNWAAAAVTRFEAQETWAVAPLVLDVADGQRIVSAGVDYSRGGRRTVRGRGLRHVEIRRLGETVLGPAIDAGIYRRAALVALGGFDTTIGETATDLDLALRARRAGLNAVFDRATQATQRRISQRTASRLRESHAAECLFWRHVPGLFRVTDLTLHGASVLGELLQGGIGRAAATLLGRAAGLCRILEQRRHFRRIAACSLAVRADLLGAASAVSRRRAG